MIYRDARTGRLARYKVTRAQLETKETSATLSELFPGAVYEIQLAAVSHGLRSERLVLRRGVRPRPAQWLRLARATSNSVLVSWAGPPRRASALGGFVLRYRTAAEPRWTALPPLAPDADRAEIPNMTHGEHYIIELDTLGEPADGDAVESDRPLREEHTVRTYRTHRPDTSHYYFYTYFVVTTAVILLKRIAYLSLV